MKIEPKIYTTKRNGIQECWSSEMGKGWTKFADFSILSVRVFIEDVFFRPKPSVVLNVVDTLMGAP